MDTQKPALRLPDTHEKAQLLFPIIGIGASAGGFAALATLLQNLPASPGMALVIVLHLPADQQSNADRVLQRSTRLPVVQVNHSTPILPDQVYIIPPARSLRMEGGHLVLHELERSASDPETIDVFFRTLAMAHREKAIGVILSGMGADGTAGLTCIKEQGGVTLVQTPAEAEHPSMPQSAIDTGMADFVLAAAQMPAKLIELRDIMQAIREHAMHGHAAAEVCFDMGPDPEQAVEDVLSLLHEHTGHDFRHYRRATLLRQLERRLQVRGQPDLPSYHALQRQDAAESQALLKDLLIGVTQFFRDREAFAMLEHTVLPQIFQGKGPGDTVRVWVAACSTGEEAYSMAMLLADYATTIPDPPAIQVFASDIDPQAIRTARAGLYPPSIAEDVPPDRLQRYFTVESGAYKVRKALRRQVLFAEHNLLHDPAFSSLDLISCRNFVIYLNQGMHRHIFEMFHFALRPDGYLILGSAENVDDASDLFALVDTRTRIYRTKPGPHSAHAPAAAPVHKLWRPSARPLERDGTPPAARRGRLFSFAEIHLHKVAEQAPPSILVDGNAEIMHIAPEASRFLRHAGGVPTRYLVELVPPAWRLALRTALFQARKIGREAGTGPVRYEEAGEQRAVDMTVQPFHDEHAEGLLMLVSFRENHDVPRPAAPADVRDQSLLEQLDEELRQTRHKLLDTMDQAEQSSASLRTTVEELKTTIEELRSANRQLETTLEKAHAANVELRTANTDLTQRLESLGKSHDDLNNLIRSSDVATLFLDRQMRIQRYTPRVAGLFNVIPADVGRPLLHITSRLENAHLAEEAARVFETLQPLEQEVRSNDGRDYIVRVHPYRTGSHRIDGAVMSFFDITSRRIAEKALRESEQRQAFLLKLSDAVRPLTSVEEIQSVTNQLLGTYLGVDRVMFAEVEGEPGAETGFIRTQYVRQAEAGRASLSRFPEHFDYRSFGEHVMAIRYRGELLVVADIDTGPDFMASERAAWAAVRVKAAIVVPLARDGRLLAEFGVQSATPRDWTEAEVSLVRDVGERTLAAVERAVTAEALQESEARFRALAEASPALIWQLDAGGALSYVNGRSQTVIGASLEQLRGTGWHGVLHPDNAAGYLSVLARALDTQDAFQQRVRVRTRDGRHRWFASYALPWHAADGQFQGLVGISIDVEEAVEAEDALKTADRRKDEFLATLAHELRNPLAPISNALQFLRYPEGKRRADRLLAMVERQVRHMVRLIDDLMEVTRISRGKVDLQRAPVALAEVLNSAVETSLPLFEQKHQQLTVEATDETIKLYADKVRLTQVFANLLNNAAKYTAPGGTAWLTVRRDGQQVRVTVRDTGMGISKEQLPLIFDMFSQPHGRKGHTDSGLGIGLAMVRSLVELHGGVVQAHSDGLGTGSEFVVRLPLIDYPNSALRNNDDTVDLTDMPLTGRRILIVDDNRDAADSLRELLAARGADTMAVYDGPSAIQALNSAIPHAVVLDIGMPDMDGYEVAHQIRQDKRAEGITLIALSGWGQGVDRERSRANGFDHHLTKPAELGSLLRLLRHDND